MMLRASSDNKGEQADINVITGEPTGDGGIAHGRLLIELVDAVLDEPDGDAGGPRRRLREAAGPGLVVEAAAVLAMFHMNDRVADACGVPLDEFGLELRYEVGDQLGMNAGELYARA